jgi:SprB repeat
MKKAFLVLGALVMTMIVTILAPSCKHELPDPCATNKIELTVNKTDVIPRKSNGTITVTATGGKDFQYSLNGGAYQSIGNFGNLAAGTYLLLVRNSWGCQDSMSIDIGTLNLCNGVTVGVTAKVTNASSGKSDGSVAITATGGNTYQYSLDGKNFQSSGTFSGLAAGNYTVTVKTENDCVGTANFTIGTTDPCAGITVLVTATQTNPTTGQSNGKITASATGGSGFTYSLNGGAYQASSSFSGLAAGTYTLTARNSNGCTGVTTVNLGASNPCAGVTITVTATTVNPTAGQSNGSITITASGGSGFTYSLNGGAYQSAASFSNLGAGSYTITAKNNTGCLGTTSVNLTATNPCSGINISVNGTATQVVPCSSPAVNGTITVTASGSSGFTYNINGGAYQASASFPNLAAGTYTVGARDANGCSSTASVVVANQAAGAKFAAVKNLITTRCSGNSCHINGGTAGGFNFDTDCNIVSFWSNINSAAVTNQNMPLSPQAKLTAAEMQIITDWVNAGHGYNN